CVLSGSSCLHIVCEFRCFFFFFQAEDGIRDWSVTGVQTCALPISRKNCPGCGIVDASMNIALWLERAGKSYPASPAAALGERVRSEERRVGKECRTRGGAGH